MPCLCDGCLLCSLLLSGLLLSLALVLFWSCVSTSENISTSEPWAFNLGTHLSNRTIFSCRKGSNFPHLKEKNHFFSCRKHQALRRRTKDDALELLQDSKETANTVVRTRVGEGRCRWNRWDARQTQKFTSHIVLYIFTHYWS